MKNEKKEKQENQKIKDERLRMNNKSVNTIQRSGDTKPIAPKKEGICEVCHELVPLYRQVYKNMCKSCIIKSVNNCRKELKKVVKDERLTKRV